MLVDDPNFAQPLAPQGTLSAGPAPFVWADGGRRMTPDEVAQQRAVAQQMEAAGMDYSPVQSWTQGADRVAQALVGGLDARRAREAGDENTAESASVAQQLMNAGPNGPDKGSVAAALVNPYLDDTTRQLAVKAYERLYPKIPEPSVQRANNGDILGINPATGQMLYHIVDPNPKPQLTWQMVDTYDQQGNPIKQLVPIGVNGPVIGGASGSPASPQPPATLPPDFDFGNGGPTPSASGNFPGR